MDLPNFSNDGGMIQNPGIVGVPAIKNSWQMDIHPPKYGTLW